jgi:hypothetical protein
MREAERIMLVRLDAAIGQNLLPRELLFAALRDVLEADPAEARAVLVARLDALETKAEEAFELRRLTGESEHCPQCGSCLRMVRRLGCDHEWHESEGDDRWRSDR